MPKLLQINVTANWGSTGRIAEECNRVARLHGWNTYYAFGRYSNPIGSNLIFGPLNKLNVYEHFLENYIFDNEGLASRNSTQFLVERIKQIEPDVVHLHNIHDHWLNYKILFEFLNNTNIKIVWTFHDFWAITGHCTHFVSEKCSRFMSECHDCPMTSKRIFPLLKNAKRNFLLKKRLFTSNKNLVIVPVSEWVYENVRQSFLKESKIVVIPNGVNTMIFKPTPLVCGNKFSILENKFVIMAVSSQWKSGTKGMEDYKSMSELLKEDEIIVLVGVSEKQSKSLPNNIVGVYRTNDQEELAALYTRADVICSFSTAETFGLSIIEGYACGTPAVVYDNTAPPSLITSETGFVVPDKDYVAAYQAIQKIKKNGKKKYSMACISFVKEKYNMIDCFNSYISLYESLISP